MDVRTLKNGGLLFCAFILSTACMSKSVSTVFPESNDAFACAGEKIKTRFIVNWEDGRTEVVRAENKNVFIQRFLQPNLAFVKHVEFDSVIRLSPDSLQTEAVGTDSWGQDMVQAAAVWNQNVKGAGVKVGVVDAEVDYTHPQLRPRLAVNAAELNGRSGVDDDGNGFVDDVYGWDFQNNKPQPDINPSRTQHGSHVAGIIAADHSTGSVKGMAPQANIIPSNFMYPVQTSDGQWTESGSLGNAISAVKYAALRGAKVISASWGGPGCSKSLKDAVASLNDQGILFVAAAGNDSADLDTAPEFPAALDLPNQLTIAASTRTDVMAYFSNSSYHYVHLAAPGDSIVSTVPGGTTAMSGTSMATPFVSGAAALLWSDRPQATVAQIRQALMNSVDTGGFRVVSRGRLNVQKALQEIRRLVP